ncbi:DUF2752 domain-containing protein [Oryzobacter terrae]|uniref:DUF2752 domain-containing protein n=1 Tax=Oryzobacter terrae TaxID=1620385 RepID=UPI003670EDF5
MTLLHHHEAAPPSTSGSRWRRLVRPGLVATAVAAGTAYVWAVDPNEPGHYPLCPTYALAGVYCPGCGMLRATHDLAHLDLAGALARNPLAPFLYLGIVLLFAVWVRARWQGRPLRWDPPRWMPWFLGVSFVVWTIARNVPGWSWASPA